MIIFDGYAKAAIKEAKLKASVQSLVGLVDLADQNLPTPKVAAIFFTQDAGSRIYTQIKHDTAERVGINYTVHEFDITTATQEVFARIEALNADPSVTGIIVQKPWRKTWVEAMEAAEITPDFNDWWHSIVSKISLAKDVDGLHPDTLASVQRGSWQKEGRVLPATCRAVLEILEEAKTQVGAKTLILGKSDLLGLPLFYLRQNQGENVELIGTKDFEQRVQSGQFLLDGDVIVSATGRPKLITGNMIKMGSIVIDVGEPSPDVDRASIQDKPSFLTPVPGGVGPMTVICLLENAVELVKK